MYKKNLQGDILGIADGGGNELCEFRYDAYGMPYVVFRQSGNGGTTIQAADLGDVIGGVAGQIVNAGLGAVVSLMFMMLFVPQGYRGYTWVFMGSTVGYYCGSRFYMPELGRFLNADAYTDTGTGVVGTNMFAYCNNNPVMFVDPEGNTVAPHASFGLQYDLGGGWYARFDSVPNAPKGKEFHVHVWNKKGDSYSQNNDGSPHDKSSNNGNPPKSVQKKLKDKTGYVWKSMKKNTSSSSSPKYVSLPVSTVILIAAVLVLLFTGSTAGFEMIPAYA